MQSIARCEPLSILWYIRHFPDTHRDDVSLYGIFESLSLLQIAASGHRVLYLICILTNSRNNNLHDSFAISLHIEDCYAYDSCLTHVNRQHEVLSHTTSEYIASHTVNYHRRIPRKEKMDAGLSMLPYRYPTHLARLAWLPLRYVEEKTLEKPWLATMSGYFAVLDSDNEDGTSTQNKDTKVKGKKDDAPAGKNVLWL